MFHSNALLMIPFKQLPKPSPLILDLEKCSDSDVDHRGHSREALETGRTHRKTNPAHDVDQIMFSGLDQQYQDWHCATVETMANA